MQRRHKRKTLQLVLQETQNVSVIKAAMRTKECHDIILIMPNYIIIIMALHHNNGNSCCPKSVGGSSRNNNATNRGLYIDLYCRSYIIGPSITCDTYGHEKVKISIDNTNLTESKNSCFGSS